MSVCERYRLVFEEEPSVLVESPGRINLIGEHIDYLDGEVMPIAINRHLSLAAGSLDRPALEVVAVGLSEGEPSVVEFHDLIVREESSEAWLNYLIGVVALYREAGVEVPGFRVLIESNLPVGAGLSSSAALETGIALIAEALAGVEQDPIDRALLCQQAEHRYAGVPCGIMDQIAVGAGREDSVVRLDCRDLSIEYIPIPEGLSILAADTGVKHSLADGEYRKRREDCDEALSRIGRESFRDVSEEEVAANEGKLGKQLYRRARHAVTEMRRVRE
ncbi:MAG: galactokinase family protein, partial [Verrucomicrobiota bacterium]